MECQQHRMAAKRKRGGVHPKARRVMRMVYPEARRGEQVDEYFGTAVADPYRWMEELDAPETTAWIAAENAVTQEYMRGLPKQAELRARMEALSDYERFSLPQRFGSRFFYSRNSGLQNQPVLYWTEGLEGEPNVLFDPNAEAADGTVALAGLSVSEDGAVAALALAEAGSDWKVVRFRVVATGEELPDVIRWTKFSTPSWLKDGSGFFYSGYEAPPDGDPLKALNHFAKVYFHAMGTPQSEDRLVFERADDPEMFLHAGVSDDGRYLFVHQSRGTSPNNELGVLDLGVSGNNVTGGVRELVGVADASYSPIANIGTKLLLQTTLDAPNGRVVQMDMDAPARDGWVPLIAERPSKLESVSLVHRTLIADYLQDAHTVVELFHEDGSFVRTLELPGVGSAGGFGGRREDTETFYSYTDFVSPGVMYRLDMRTFESTVYREPKVLFDRTGYVSEQVFATSKDGTRVPLFLTYRKDLVRDGNNPALLYGYGGFGISLTPAFSPSTVAWLEHGGIYAQACLRGGGEYGEEWHAAGTKLRKQNVFDDFAACAEYLVAENYTSASKLAIQGGSNGGLLVGAMLTQRPELFAAANAAVGVMDMLRFDQFTVGWGWKQDYGGPRDDEAEFRALLAYSPLHNLRKGATYPAILVTTGDHDDRVFPAHSFKFVAEMQRDQAGPAPILIRVEVRAGHGGGMPLGKRLDVAADTFAFFLRELGCDG